MPYLLECSPLTREHVGPFKATTTRQGRTSPDGLVIEGHNLILQTEWAYRQVFTRNAERAAALASWLEYHNSQRRRSALGGLPPISRLSPT